LTSEKNYNMIVLSSAKITMGEQVEKKKNWFYFELESESVKYILASKYETDYNEWVYSIYAQIDLAN
jgi:hypothetical protein